MHRSWFESFKYTVGDYLLVIGTQKSTFRENAPLRTLNMVERIITEMLSPFGFANSFGSIFKKTTVFLLVIVCCFVVN